MSPGFWRLFPLPVPVTGCDVKYPSPPQPILPHACKEKEKLLVRGINTTNSFSFFPSIKWEKANSSRKIAARDLGETHGRRTQAINQISPKFLPRPPPPQVRVVSLISVTKDTRPNRSDKTQQPHLNQYLWLSGAHEQRQKTYRIPRKLSLM